LEEVEEIGSGDAAFLLPSGEKDRMRGSDAGDLLDDPNPLTPTLSPLGRGVRNSLRQC
jgi:hypothetical protein